MFYKKILKSRHLSFKKIEKKIQNKVKKSLSWNHIIIHLEASIKYVSRKGVQDEISKMDTRRYGRGGGLQEGEVST
jgi:hypothetical protein